VTSSFVIGIDLGGTKVAAATLRDGKLSASTLHPTKLSSSGVLIDQLVEIVQQVRGDEPLDAVGIGVPSIVEFATGRVVSSVNIPLVDVPLRAVLGERLRVPVFVDNDATVAALAEAHDESLQLVSHNLVMLTIGTGVGGGIVLGGRIFRGATGGAGELGHTLVAVASTDDVLPPRHFPQPDSLEGHASGRALDRLAVEIGFEGGGAVVRAAHAGDPRALAAVARWARMVGVGIANAISTFDPDEVVLGGGAATAAGELLLEHATEVARAYTVPGLGTKTQIRLARFHATAGVLGAALLAAQELEVPTPVRSGAAG
jgi:glucokinase